MSRGGCRVQQGGFPVANVNNWHPSDINDEQIAIIRPGIFEYWRIK